MQKINESESMQELKDTVQESQKLLSSYSSLGKQFEHEKQLFDQKFDGGRYSYIINRQHLYEDLIEKIDLSQS